MLEQFEQLARDFREWANEERAKQFYDLDVADAWDGAARKIEEVIEKVRSEGHLDRC